MTDREKLLDILKVAYEPRKIPQEDGSVAIYYPTDEDVADMIWAAIIDEYKHRAEVAEKAFLILWNECKEKLGWDIDCTMWYAKQAEKELMEGKKERMKSIKYVTAREEADRINQEIDDKSIHVRTYIDNYDIIHAEVYFSPNGGMSPHEAVQKAAKMRLAALRAASFKYNGYRIGY